MSDIEKFSEKILERMRLNQKELSQRQLETNAEMAQLLAQRDRFNNAARGILSTVVYPRMQELSRHFDNAKLIDIETMQDLHVVCQFSHTSRYPAKVTLDIALFPGEEFSKVDVHYGLNILPMLIEYQRNEERSFSLQNEEEIGRWVEEKMLDFVETYLQLQIHPLYQKDNLVTDPICNMRFPIDEAAGNIELHGQRFYFCSKVCKDTFSKVNNVEQ